MAVPDLQDALDCLQQKDVDGAISSLEAKIDELPAHLTAHVLLARAYETKRQWARALSCWENVHFLMPNSPVAREGKQRVLEHMNEPDDTADDEPADVQDQTSSEPSEQSTTGTEDPTDSGAVDGGEIPPSPDAAGPSNLDELRQQADDAAQKRRARTSRSEAPGGPSPAENASNGESGARPADASETGAESDLDHLIDELESARIEPDPDLDEVDPPDLSNDVDDLVSETLARIHEAQDQYREAAQIYVKLASQEPEQARSYLERAAEMREKAEEKAKADD